MKAHYQIVHRSLVAAGDDLDFILAPHIAYNTRDAARGSLSQHEDSKANPLDPSMNDCA